MQPWPSPYPEGAILATAHSTWNETLTRLLGPAEGETVHLNCGTCEKTFKCCDFQPFVANFLLGAILESGGELPPPSEDFHYRPLGLMASRAFRTRHRSEESRGVCVFFDRLSRACRIWKFRPAECSAYLCQPRDLEAMEAVSWRGFRAETGLAQMALVYQGFSNPEISWDVDFLNAPDGMVGSVERYHEIYRASWTWVRHLERSTVDEILKECDEPS